MHLYYSFVTRNALTFTCKTPARYPPLAGFAWSRALRSKSHFHNSVLNCDNVVVATVTSATAPNQIVTMFLVFPGGAKQQRILGDRGKSDRSVGTVRFGVVTVARGTNGSVFHNSVLNCDSVVPCGYHCLEPVAICGGEGKTQKASSQFGFEP